MDTDDTSTDEPGLILEPREGEDASANPLPPLLPQGARAAMQRLLATGVVLGRNHADDLNLLTNNKDQINQVLAELGLAMLVKHEYGLAALTRVGAVDVLEDSEDLADDGDDDDGNRNLLRATRLKFYHSIILSVLRAFYREREIAMDHRVIIELETLKDRIKPFFPLIQSESRSDKQLSGAVKLLERHSILMTVRDNKDAREISPVIMLAMSATKAAAFEAELDRHLAALERSEHTGDGDGA